MKISIDKLEAINLTELSKLWRRLFRKRTPPHLPRYLVLRMIAYRLQANAEGDLDVASVRYLNKIVRECAASKTSCPDKRHKRGATVPAVMPATLLKPGSLLVREHAGVVHKVVVANNNRFLWNDKPYKSLSEIAVAITGTRWNGPRFFGLRQKSETNAKAVE